jgi:CIC family chloride channel protein
MWWPAIGALALGIIGYFVPRVLGVGYDTISDILNTRMVLGALLAVMIFKSAALVISLGSGTSGGLLAPMFMASAAMGSAYAMIIDKIWPAAGLSPGAFALVAMGAVFGAASRAAFTFIIFAFEITRDYNSVLPLMLVTVIADAIAVRYAKNSIMTEKLARRGLQIHQDYAPDVLQQVLVRDTMSQQYDTVPATMPVTELVERIGKHDPSVTKHQAVFVLDENGALTGIVTRGDLMRSLERAQLTPMTVLEAGTHPALVAFPDEVLYDATARMLRANVGRMPVVKREEPTQIVGYLGRTEIMGARLRQLDEESVREHGWVAAFRRTG